MLYHVPDRAAAARELRRVLRPDGVCVASTNSERNVPELVDLVERAVGGGWRWARASFVDFSLENGADQPRAGFEHVEVVEGERSTVHVTDADLLADYVASVSAGQEDRLPRAWPEVVEEVRRRAREVIARDAHVTLTPRGGAFVCR